MIIYRKSPKELEQEAVKNLGGTRINATGDGSVALSIIKSVNSIISQLYQDLDNNIQSGFLSTAQDGFLDLIGELLSCYRLPGESNDNYRYRISQQVNVSSGANRAALEIETSSLEGVRKVVLAPYTRGIGSFSAFVVPSTYDSLNSSLVNVQNVLNSLEAFGIRGVAEAPKPLLVKMKLQVSFKNSVSQSTHSSIKESIKRELKILIDRLDMGNDLIISEIFQRVRNVNDNILDVSIQSITVNNKPILVANYIPRIDEKFFVEHINDIIVN